MLGVGQRARLTNRYRDGGRGAGPLAVVRLASEAMIAPSGMLYVDNSALADPEVLRGWVQRGTEYVKAHPAAAKRRKHK